MHTDTATALDMPVPVVAPSVFHVTEAAAIKIQELLKDYEKKLDQVLEKKIAEIREV